MSYIDKELFRSRRGILPSFLRELLFKIGRILGYYISYIGKQLGQWFYILSLYTSNTEKEWEYPWGYSFE